MGKLTVGSLFAGIGGFDLGLERAGMEVKWQVEVDPLCQRVLAKHWPHVTRYGDITKVDWSTVEPVDLVCGGFPCQDLSVAGKRAGIDGSRSGLWSEYVRCLRTLRPRYVLVENVPGLLANPAMGRVLGDLASCGYDAEWDCLPAAAFGAAHIRDRVWILAYSRCQLGGIQSNRNDGYNIVFPSGDRKWNKTEWGEDRKLIALVPGIDSRTPADRWRTQSRMDRSSNGIPDQMDRNKAIGNSVYPDAVEWIGRRIIEVHNESISPLR